MKREPHSHSVFRFLMLAADEARKGRLPMTVRYAIKIAMLTVDRECMARNR